MAQPDYLFLARFARVTFNSDRRADLRRAAEEFQARTVEGGQARSAADFRGRSPDWTGVVSLAEEQGLAPLLDHLLRQAGIVPPPGAGKTLWGLALHHRHASQARTQLLGEVLDGLDRAGIPTLVLKGGALAHLVYPEPGLRPMGDLDLLVPPAALRPARDVLLRLGCTSLPAGPGTGWQAEHRHPPPLRRIVDGLPVVIELHTDLFAQSGERPPRTGDWWANPLPFRLSGGGAAAQTLRPGVMLLHLCWHLVNMRHLAAQVARPRLIWVADVVGFAECFQEELDWAEIRTRQPLVASTLALLGDLVPLPESLRRRLGPPPAGRPPRGVGQGYRGWPARPFGAPDRGPLLSYLGDTFLPPEWWLRLHYGLGPGGRVFPTRWFRHPAAVLRGAAHKLGRPFHPRPEGDDPS
jgi:hypothetical protein